MLPLLSRLRYDYFLPDSRRKATKGDNKSAKETAIKEELEGSSNFTKASVNSDVDDEKERKKDRELLVK
jgi:hypothetical protein